MNAAMSIAIKRWMNLRKKHRNIGRGKDMSDKKNKTGEMKINAVMCIAKKGLMDLKIKTQKSWQKQK